MTCHQCNLLVARLLQHVIVLQIAGISGSTYEIAIFHDPAEVGSFLLRYKAADSLMEIIAPPRIARSFMTSLPRADRNGNPQTSSLMFGTQLSGVVIRKVKVPRVRRIMRALPIVLARGAMG